MECNKNGIGRYYRVDDILNLGLDLVFLKDVEKKLGKKVFFGFNDSCMIGKLVGVAIGKTPQYIISVKGKEIFIPSSDSVTLL